MSAGSTEANTDDDTASRGAAPFLLAVEGRAWVRRGCVAAAWETFRDECPDPVESRIARLLLRYRVLRRLFTLRDGRGLLAAGGLCLIQLPVSSENSLTVRLDRLIAFSDSLAFRSRFIRRIPMSGAGGWHSATLSGDGWAVVGAMGDPIVLRPANISDMPTASEELDLDPDSALAWSGNAELRFTLRRLSWFTMLSFSGYRETRLTLSGYKAVWLDASASPRPIHQISARTAPRDQTPKG